MKDTHGGDIWQASTLTGIPPGDIIDFSANINPLGPSPMASLALKEALGMVGAYPEPGAGTLKEALSDHHHIPPDRILPANGSTELIYLIPRVLAPKTALVVEPAFSEYVASLVPLGCRVDEFLTGEEDSFALDTERLATKLKNRYDVFYLANPSNPAGALIDKEPLLHLARKCREHGTVLVVDEAFADFTEGQSIKKEAAELGGVVVLRSMTKFFSLAGLRLGYMVASEELIKRFTEHIQPWAVNTLAMVAGEATLRDRAYMERTLRWFGEEKKRASGELAGIPALKVFPSKANFSLLKLLTDAFTATSLKKVLLERRILIRELSSVRGLGESFFRVALLKRRDNELLAETLRSLLPGVKSIDNPDIPCYK